MTCRFVRNNYLIVTNSIIFFCTTEQNIRHHLLNSFSVKERMHCLIRIISAQQISPHLTQLIEMPHSMAVQNYLNTVD